MAPRRSAACVVFSPNRRPRIESEERQDEPEEARAPEPEEEDADELMPDPTLRGVVSPPMAPFMARRPRAPLPPAPRRRARAVRRATASDARSTAAAAARRRGDARVRGAPGGRVRSRRGAAEEVEEEDAIVEVTQRPARRGRPEPAFEGLEALRARPADYHELAAVLLASAGASIEGGDRPLVDFRRDLISSARASRL